MAPIRIARFASIDSTNRELLRRARAGEPEGLVLVAEQQTAGRGRQGRSWLSPGGSGLTFSVLRRPPVAATEASRWSWIAALAVHGAVQPLLPAPGAWLKWPNDLLIGDRKVSGLLSEVIFDGDQVGAIVVGIGLNVHTPLAGWPDDLADRATSLEESGAVVDATLRERLLTDIVGALIRIERSFLEGGAGPLMDQVRAAMAPLMGGRVEVHTGGARVVGTVQGIRDNGALEVVDEQRNVRLLLAGDVHIGTGAVECFS